MLKLNGFEIDKFVSGLKDTVKWMSEYKGEIKDKSYKPLDEQLYDLKKWKEELNNNPDYPFALSVLTELLVTNAWYYTPKEYFKSEIVAFQNECKENFRETKARERLVKLVEDNAPTGKIRIQASEKMQELLDILDKKSIKQFTAELNELAEKGKTIILGEKGRDNYLRDFGFWRRIPMDRHEMRFIIRTGMYHVTMPTYDPLKKGDMHNVLTNFCSKYLIGFNVEGIDLSHSPGVLDMFIWNYCAKLRFNICGSKPKCEKCRMNNVCLYGQFRNN
jgi:hypothetical protein